MSAPPAQSYKISSLGEAGGGTQGGSSFENTAGQTAFTAGGNSLGAGPGGHEPRGTDGQTSGPQQEVAGTLPTDFRLAGTKAESKGEEKTVPNELPGDSLSTGGHGGDKIHQPKHAHDVDMPPNKPHLAAQSNEQSETPPHKRPGQVDDLSG